MVTIRKLKKETKPTSIDKDVEEIWTLVYCRQEHKWCNHWKTVRWFLRNLKTKCPRASAILLLSRYPKESRGQKRYLYTHVPSSTIHKSQEVEASTLSMGSLSFP